MKASIIFIIKTLLCYVQRSQLSRSVLMDDQQVKHQVYSQRYCWECVMLSIAVVVLKHLQSFLIIRLQMLSSITSWKSSLGTWMDVVCDLVSFSVQYFTFSKQRYPQLVIDSTFSVPLSLELYRTETLLEVTAFLSSPKLVRVFVQSIAWQKHRENILYFFSKTPQPVIKM